MTMKHVKKYLSEIGRKGGSKTSERKRLACLRNSQRSKELRAQRKQEREKQ
jgi:general stress protein YciG